MRILTYTSLFPNAKQPLHGIFVYQRVAHLARRPGNEDVVVAPVPYFPRVGIGGEWGDFARVPREERISDLSIFHPRYPLLPKVSMLFHGWLMYLGCRALVRQLHAEIPFDVIDAHFIYPDGFAAVLLGRLLKIPVSVSARGTDMNVYPSLATIRPMLRWTLQHADARITVSDSLRARVAEVAGMRQTIHVIPNGVDAARFKRIELSEARRKLGLPAEGPCLVSVGSLIESKGHQHLVRAVHRLSKKYEGLHLSILGDGPYRASLKALAAKLGISERVHFLGKRPNEELPLWYCAATLTCLASSREGWPNALSESLACGTPVVATRVGGVSEIVTGPQFGVLAEPNADSVQAAVGCALETQWDREAIARASCARTWALVAEEVETVLREAVSKGPTPH